jgi:hypothetical protein
MRRGVQPQNSSGLILAQGLYIALAGAVFFGFGVFAHRAFQTERLPNPGMAGYAPPDAVVLYPKPRALPPPGEPYVLALASSEDLSASERTAAAPKPAEPVAKADKPKQPRNKRTASRPRDDRWAMGYTPFGFGGYGAFGSAPARGSDSYRRW